MSELGLTRPPDTPAQHPTALVLVVGFLGAGKTTLLRHLLPILEARGFDPFTIINDYANARVDAATLAEKGRTVTPIRGNCICCDSISELTDVLLQAPRNRRSLILIEANGTTDPTALIEHLLVNPKLRCQFSPLLQLAVVDARRWQKRHWHNALERLQVQTASHIYLTREDEVPNERIQQIWSDIDWLNPNSQWVKIPSFASELEKIAHAVSSPQPVPPASPRSGNHHQDHHDSHDDHHSHSHHELSHGFIGLEIDLPNPIATAHLQTWLRELPEEVLRAKGVVRLAERPDRWFQFQKTDHRWAEAALYELPEKPPVPPCAVLIGVGLERLPLELSLAQTLQKITT